LAIAQSQALRAAEPLSSTVLPLPQPYARRQKRRINLRLFMVSGAILLTLLMLVGAGLALHEYLQELRVVSWTTYVSEEGGFTVRLPTDSFANVFKQTKETRQNIGQWPPYTFEGIVLDDGTKVGVYYFDSPSPTSDPEEALEGLVRFLARQFHGDITFEFEREFTLGSYSGKETICYREKGAQTEPIYSRWYLVGGRVYEVAWIPGRNEPSEEALFMLWDSFQIVKPDRQSKSAEVSGSR
jgi:hypothetical protein